MVNYRPHTLIAFGGRLAEGASYGEIWECTIRGGSSNKSTNTDLQPFAEGDLDRLAQDVAGALQTWFASGGSGISNDTNLTYVKANNITSTGHYASASTHLANVSPPVSGAGTPAAPNFCSVAYTWETGLERGRAHRGRMYPPNNTYAFQGGVIGTGNAGLAQAAGIALLRAIYSAPNEGTLEDTFKPAVMSAIDASWHWITGCTVDTVYDVQRRRKNQAPSQRTAFSPFLPLP